MKLEFEVDVDTTLTFERLGMGDAWFQLTITQDHHYSTGPKRREVAAVVNSGDTRMEMEAFLQGALGMMK